MIISSGLTVSSGIKFVGETIASAIGNTSSTVTPSTSGTVAVVTSSPFGSGNSYQITHKSTTPYSFLSTPGSSGFAFGSGDYTIEWFQYQTDAQSFPRVFWYGNTPTYGVSIEGGTFYYWPNGTPNALIGSAQIGTYKNVWVHFAIVRIGSKLYVYKDGVLKSSALGVTNATNHTDSASTFYIGSKAGGGLSSEQFGGNIQSFRIVKGVGVYTGNFTKPTSLLAQTQSENPYGGSNTSAITSGQCSLLINA